METGQNYHRASEWFLLAGGLGRHRDAQFALGDLYFHGRGVPHSYGQAINCYKKRAIRSRSMSWASCTARAGGIDDDLVEAFKWISLALPNAKIIEAYDTAFKPVRARKKLLLRMNRSQLERADKLIAAWKPQW